MTNTLLQVREDFYFIRWLWSPQHPIHISFPSCVACREFHLASLPLLFTVASESFYLSCMTSFLPLDPPQAAPNPTLIVWSRLISQSVYVNSRHIYSNMWPLFVSRTERSTLTAFLTPTPSSWCSASCPTRPPRPSTSGRCRAKITSQRPASLWTVSFSLCSHRVCCESNVMVVCEGSSCASLCLFIKKSLSGV